MARKKPCEFCDAESFYDDGPEHSHRNGFTMWHEWYPDNGLFSVIAQANTEEGECMEDSIDFTFNYCPMCGRKLDV